MEIEILESKVLVLLAKTPRKIWHIGVWGGPGRNYCINFTYRILFTVILKKSDTTPVA